MRIVSVDSVGGPDGGPGREAGGDGSGGPSIDVGSLRPLMGASREALTRGLGRPGAPVPGVPDGLLVSCSCGHLYLADR